MNLKTGLTGPEKQLAESRELLKRLQKLAKGERVYDPFYGGLSPECRNSLSWARAVVNNYIRQYEVGTCCLLSEHITELRELRSHFDQKLNKK